MRKELKVSDWFNEIKSCLEFRSLYGREKAWNELEALYSEAKDLGDSRGPNLIASIGDATVSQLTSSYPYIMTEPRRQELVQNARVLESVDNQLLEETQLPEEVGTALLHAFLWGVGILKIGYDSEYGWDPFSLNSMEKQLGLSLSSYDKKGNLLEYKERVKPGMPWVSVCLPHDILVPWGTMSFADAPYVIHRVIRHIEDVKADSKYEHTRDLKPVYTAKEVVESYEGPLDPDIVIRPTASAHNIKTEFVELWEIRDVRTGKIKVIATGHDKFLRDEPDALQEYGLPFEDIALVPRTRSFWVTPDAFYLLPYQDELTDISIQGSKQRKLATVKFLYQEGAIDPDEMDKLLSDKVGAGVKINRGADIREAVSTFTPHNQNVSLYAVDGEYVRRGARETAGFSRNQLGEYEQKGRRTASEVMAVREGSGIKMSRRQLQVRKLYLNVMRKVNGVIFRYWTGNKWAQVGGDWVPYNGPMLRGDYGYDLVFGTKNPIEDPESRALQNLNLYRVLSQDPFVDQMKLRELLQMSMPNPEFRKVFKTDANVSIPMSQMQQGGGAPGQNAGQELPNVS